MSALFKSRRTFYAVEWGMYSKAVEAPSTVMAFQSAAARDAWVREADDVPHGSRGAREPLTARERLRWYRHDPIFTTGEAER